MTPILAITRATILELRRQRLIIVPIIGLVLSLLILGAGIILADDSIGTRDAADAAWATGFGAGVAASIYALIVGASLIASDLSSGTLLMLAARPIPRWQIIAGRIAGTAAFLIVSLVFVDIVYGLVASSLSGSLDPFDDALSTLVFTVPAMLLALCMATALSVQNRATAATGSALAFAVFALSVSLYASEILEDRHLRGYLVSDVRSELPVDKPVIDFLSVVSVRVLPFGVFVAQGIDIGDDRTRERYESEVTPYGNEDGGRIDVRNPGPFSWQFTQATVATTAPPGAASPAVPAGAAPLTTPLPKNVDEIPGDVYTCGRANCFLGIPVAWKRNVLPPAPTLHDDWSIALGWLMIPLWAGVAMLLLTKRRDLV